MKGGKCVRLFQGRADQETVFADDPVEAARRWAGLGAEYLHLVDLDGAFEGQPRHMDLVGRIVQATGLPVEVGGGIRAREHVAAYLGLGVDRVIVGTRALESLAWLESLCAEFPGRIAVGVDARDGRVATHGWVEVSDVPAVDFARTLGGLGIAAVIFTDISRDGAMRGANLEATCAFAEACPAPVIASGGVTTLDDVRALCRLPVVGAIIGRALYDGRIDLAGAMALARGESA
jgi:phosphoribosylformimino-5-aminoimidazole carboxamide ribotide isomerase